MITSTFVCVCSGKVHTHTLVLVMGNKLVVLTEEQLDIYQDCTYFARKDILRIQKRYLSLAPHLPKVMTGDEADTAKAPLQLLEKMPELKENPFNRRLCKVFSEDNTGHLTFNEFLNLFSVFSEHACRDIKLHYAFKIFDFDGDEKIGCGDLKAALYALTRSGLKKDEVDAICDKILEESDFDGDGKLSFMEFKHAVSKSPDFINNFKIKI